LNDKVLITFVGNHDPYTDEKKSLGPILSILKKREFDKLYLLFNNDRYWNSLTKTQEYCNKNYPQMKVKYRETRSLNPIDYNFVYPAMYQIVNRINKDNPNIVYAGVQGQAWGTNSERGVFKTTDGGKSWKKILYVNESTGIADLVMDPSNPNKLVAAMWEFGRKPWTFNSGGEGSGMHITYDGGETW